MTNDSIEESRTGNDCRLNKNVLQIFKESFSLKYHGSGSLELIKGENDGQISKIKPLRKAVYLKPKDPTKFGLAEYVGFSSIKKKLDSNIINSSFKD
jgi:hypothetical protein